MKREEDSGKENFPRDGEQKIVCTARVTGEAACARRFAMSDPLKTKWPRAWLGALILACVAGGALVVSQRVATPPGKPANAPSLWTAQTIKDLSLEAPFALDITPDVSGSLPPEVRELVEIWQTREGASPSGDLRAQVSHITYRAGVALDLDDAAEGAMSNAAQVLGDEDPKPNTTAMQLAGLDSRRSTYQGKLGRQSITIDAIFIQRGQELWQIQAVSTSPAMRLAGERLLQSVRLQSPPKITEEPAPAAALP